MANRVDMGRIDNDVLIAPDSDKLEGKTIAEILDGVDLSDLTERVEGIEELIPTTAATDNLLATVNFVNSSIENMAARYLTPTAAADTSFASLAALNTGGWFWNGASVTPTQNDYALFVNADGKQQRGTFQGTSWSASYVVNDTPFTAGQLAAINSGITAALVAKLTALPDNSGLTALLAGKQNSLTAAQLANTDNTVRSVSAATGQANGSVRMSVNTNGTTANLDLPVAGFGTKAENTQATLNAGSGTDLTTTAQTNPTVWGMLQTIWNRIFALNSNKANNAMALVAGSGTDVTTPATATNTSVNAHLQNAWNRIFALNNLKANDTMATAAGSGTDMSTPALVATTTTTTFRQNVWNRLSALANGKQNTLVGTGAGQNIKTVNGENVLGTGNIVTVGSFVVGRLTQSFSMRHITLGFRPSFVIITNKQDCLDSGDFRHALGRWRYGDSDGASMVAIDGMTDSGIPTITNTGFNMVGNVNGDLFYVAFR
jgi:hypothetical protein